MLEPIVVFFVGFNRDCGCCVTSTNTRADTDGATFNNRIAIKFRQTTNEREKNGFGILHECGNK